jgi:hypothetical protein
MRKEGRTRFARRFLVQDMACRLNVQKNWRFRLVVGTRNHQQCGSLLLGAGVHCAG